MAEVIEVTVLEDGTSEVVERDFTAAEQAQRTADEEAARVADMHAEADRQTAIAKLAALGLTPSDLAALGIG
jgi:hypothetical protein